MTLLHCRPSLRRPRRFRPGPRTAPGHSRSPLDELAGDDTSTLWGELCNVAHAATDSASETALTLARRLNLKQAEQSWDIAWETEQKAAAARLLPGLPRRAVKKDASAAC